MAIAGSASVGSITSYGGLRRKQAHVVFLWQCEASRLRWPMTLRRAAVFTLFGLCSISVAAPPSPAPPRAAPEPPRLPSDQLAKAIQTDALTIPTPGELFAALQKPGKPNWPAQ